MSNTNQISKKDLSYSKCFLFRRYIKEEMDQEKVLILQCDNGDESSDLIASARHLCHQSKLLYADWMDKPFHIIFIINLRRVAQGCQRLGSFHGVNWVCVHIDELRPSSDELPSLIQFANDDMSSLFEQFASRDERILTEGIRMTLPDTGMEVGDTGIEVDDTGMEVADIGVEVADTGMEVADTEVEIADTGMEVGDTVMEIADTGMELAYTGMELADTGMEVSDVIIESSGRASPNVASGVEVTLLLGILRRCVQSSTVKSVTSDEESKRLTRRIRLLFDLLSINCDFVGKIAVFIKI